MRIGLVVRKDRTGLGYQTKALYDLLKPHRVLVIDSTPFNGNAQIDEWYEDAKYKQVSNGFPTDNEISLFLNRLDVVITCEVPYNYTLFSMARKRGIKTILQPNPEFNQHFRDKALPKPDAFFTPSRWYEKETTELGVPTYYCPPPITIGNPNRKITKQKGRLKVLHIGGKPAYMDRNGTRDVQTLRVNGVEVFISQQVMSKTDSNEDLYKGDYDVVLIPRKYGGLCLPMREALAFGYPVIMPNIVPNRGTLPQEWLTAPRMRVQRMMKRTINVYENDIRSITKKLEYFRDMTPEQYEEDVSMAYQINADINSDSKWEEYIDEVVNGTIQNIVGI